jgi:hypothetical protein
MALIKCPECQREISDQAAACPHCELPIAVGLERRQRTIVPSVERSIVRRAATLETELERAVEEVARDAAQQKPSRGAPGRGKKRCGATGSSRLLRLS